MGEVAAGAPLGASYKLVKLIGKGASGQVWRLEHSKKSEPLIAKILHQHLAEDHSVVERFVRERSVLISLQHEHIVTVHDLVVEGSTLALVMDYYSGGSLRDQLEQRGTFKPALALQLVATVLETLAYAHGQNVIHRDIKPDNILLAAASQDLDSQQIRITDFGIASIIHADHANTTGIVGTPYYLPPELIQHGTSGAAGDVYSTGIMLYELLAGRTPFAGEGTDFTIAYRHISAQVPVLDVPEPIMQVLMALLDKNPSQRPHPLDAASQLRVLAQRFESLPALQPMPSPRGFAEAKRPETVIRGSGNSTASLAPEPAEDAAPPILGASARATIIKPQHVERAAQDSEHVESPVVQEVKKSRSKAIWLSVLGVLLLAGAGWGIYWAVSAHSKPGEPFSAMGSQETPLPTGLSVRREATYNPSSSTIELKIIYSAQKAPLSGDLLEVLPATEDGDSCPNASWENADAQRNQPTVTDMNVQCGWNLQNVEIMPNQELEITGKVSAQVADQQELEKWLDAVSEQTQDAITSKDYKSASYPIQRLTDIAVKVPERTVSQTVVPVTLLPVWPSGEDALNPLYSSETFGKPSSMLQAIAGDKDPVRFSDGCAGHLMVDASGQKITALSVADQCSVNAQVGNFTDLQSNNFAISTRR